MKRANMKAWITVALLAGPLLALIGFLTARSEGGLLSTKEPVRISVAIIKNRTSAQTEPGLALYEPKEGCYLGAYIDLADELTRKYTDMNGRVRKLPSEFESIVAKKHSIYFFYLGYGQRVPMDWLRLLTIEGKFVHIALEPNAGLDQVQDDAFLQGLADDLRNSRARVFLRFASEMNGPWVRYSGDPKKYVEKWQLVTRIMRERAPNVAMVWCPYATPVGTIPAYYPGDEWVDWVGVNFYSVTYFNQNRKTPAFHVKPGDFLQYIYQNYSAKKPIMICEYGTTHFSALENKNFAAFAINNIETLYRDLKRKYPRVKGINYFNTNNLRLEHRQNNNYSVTHDMEVLAAYRNAIKDPHFLSNPPDGLMSGPGHEIRPISDGDQIKGRTELILWAYPNKHVEILRVGLGDKKVGSFSNVENWKVFLETQSVPEGEVPLRIEAFDSSGRRVAEQVTRIVVRY